MRKRKTPAVAIVSLLFIGCLYGFSSPVIEEISETDTASRAVRSRETGNRRTTGESLSTEDPPVPSGGERALLVYEEDSEDIESYLMDSSPHFDRNEPGNPPRGYDVTITPADYGFDDAYPTDSDTRNNFIDHRVDGLSFQTRRYRTGYIQQEYIVMSPNRLGVNEAFIEYRFDTAITAMSVELTHWREFVTEQLDDTTGMAVFQIFAGNEWVTQLDLLDPDTDLPRDRTDPAVYSFEFDSPVYRMRFYSEYWGIGSVQLNRGRICIGEMKLDLSEYSLPLSGAEPGYEPKRWNDESIKSQYNCYAYALDTQELGWIEIGFTEGKSHDNVEGYHSREILTELLFTDMENLGIEIEAIGKNERCDAGFYKIALVVDPSKDFHFYRQNSDGTWSHKRGQLEVDLLDASDAVIYDPETCDRDYRDIKYQVYDGYYRNFIGFFQIDISSSA